MYAGTDDKLKFPDLLRDPLIRLVMESDGVTKQEMIAVMHQLRRALAAREKSHALRRAAATVLSGACADARERRAQCVLQVGALCCPP
jgi:hypothetical protein